MSVGTEAHLTIGQLFTDWEYLYLSALGNGYEIINDMVYCRDKDYEFYYDFRYIYVLRKGSKKPYKVRASESFKTAVLSVMAQNRVVVRLSYTKWINNELALIPVIDQRPKIIGSTVKRGAAISVGDYVILGDKVYVASETASLVPVQLRFYNEAVLPESHLTKVYDMWHKLLNEDNVILRLAALPYVHPHVARRRIPVITGPMRSGKTTTAEKIIELWPEPKYKMSIPSTASLRNTISKYHIFADDIGENRQFDWTLLIGYHDRTSIARVSPETLNLRVFYLAGALLAATNFYTINLKSVGDRIDMVNVSDLKDKVQLLSEVDTEVLELLALIPRTEAALIEGIVEYPYVEKKEERVQLIGRMEDPYVKVLRLIYQHISKELAARGELSTTAIIEGVAYHVYRLKVAIDLGGNLSVSLTKTKSASPSKSITQTVDYVRISPLYAAHVVKSELGHLGVFMVEDKVYIPVEKAADIRDYIKAKLGL